MNYAAADTASARSVVAFTAAPVFAAIVTDRVVSVVRRHALGVEEPSAWKGLGRFLTGCARAAALTLLYGLRLCLAFRETAAGLRQAVLNAAPLPQPPVDDVTPTRRRSFSPRTGPPPSTACARLPPKSRRGWPRSPTSSGRGPAPGATSTPSWPDWKERAHEDRSRRRHPSWPWSPLGWPSRATVFSRPRRAPDAAAASEEAAEARRGRWRNVRRTGLALVQGTRPSGTASGSAPDVPWPGRMSEPRHLILLAAGPRAVVQAGVRARRASAR